MTTHELGKPPGPLFSKGRVEKMTILILKIGDDDPLRKCDRWIPTRYGSLLPVTRRLLNMPFLPMIVIAQVPRRSLFPGQEECRHRVRDALPMSIPFITYLDLQRCYG